VTLVVLPAPDADPAILEDLLSPLRALLHAPSPPVILNPLSVYVYIYIYIYIYI
jgi:hypothetical protein